MKKYTQEEYNAIPRNEYGVKVCPTGNYTQVNIIEANSSFGAYCSFE